MACAPLISRHGTRAPTSRTLWLTPNSEQTHLNYSSVAVDINACLPSVIARRAVAERATSASNNFAICVDLQTS